MVRVRQYESRQLTSDILSITRHFPPLLFSLFRNLHASCLSLSASLPLCLSHLSTGYVASRRLGVQDIPISRETRSTRLGTVEIFPDARAFNAFSYFAKTREGRRETAQCSATSSKEDSCRSGVTRTSGDPG